MLVNGERCAHISTEDRGLLYGDGVFETILCEKGKPVLFAEHMQRLQLGCKKLNLPLPNIEIILAETQQVAKQDDGIVKIILTRGVRARGYQYDPQDQEATRIIYRSEMADIPHSNYQNGVRLRLCKHRLPENECLAEIKHLNRLDQVIARSEWSQDYQEGVMLSGGDYVIEGTMTNIFVKLQDVWQTPKLNRCGVRGVMRDFILLHTEEMAVDCVEVDIPLHQLNQADAMFVCNSVIGIWPVINFESTDFAIDKSVTRMMKYLHENVSSLYVSR